MERGTSILEIQDKEVRNYQWDFKIPPKSRIQDNISAVSGSGFSFSDLKFKTGFLSEVEHSWGLSVYANQINVYLSLPRRTAARTYTVYVSKLELISQNQIKSSHKLVFKKDPYTHPAHAILWAAFWVNSEYAWTDIIDTIRINLNVGCESAGKCLKLMDAETRNVVWSETVAKEVDATDFFLSSDLSDVVIQCHNREFYAHRFLLACKSSVFASMFQHDMRETQEGRVVIEDVDSDTMLELLRFIYTGRVEKFTLLCTDLLIASDKYLVLGLKKKCETLLVGQVTPENSLDMYALADTYGANTLMDKSLEVLKRLSYRNKKKIVSDTEMFKEFAIKYPDLMYELFRI